MSKIWALLFLFGFGSRFRSEEEVVVVVVVVVVVMLVLVEDFVCFVLFVFAVISLCCFWAFNFNLALNNDFVSKLLYLSIKSTKLSANSLAVSFLTMRHISVSSPRISRTVRGDSIMPSLLRDNKTISPST